MPAPAPASDPEPAAAIRADTTRRGWLRVGGDSLIGARVETDGNFVGYAPLELALPVGGHLIVVTSRTDRVVVRKRVHISEAQTRLLPLRILR